MFGYSQSRPCCRTNHLQSFRRRPMAQVKKAHVVYEFNTKAATTGGKSGIYRCIVKETGV